MDDYLVADVEDDGEGANNEGIIRKESGGGGSERGGSMGGGSGDRSRVEKSSRHSQPNELTLPAKM